MSLILSIETSGTSCSVALGRDSSLLGELQIDLGYSHNENLAQFVHDLMAESKVSIKNLDAISLSSGPGSYTGLRIGSAFCKGLCTALAIPLITIDSLLIMTMHSRVRELEHDFDLLLPSIDARREEIYFGLYTRERKLILQSRPLILSDENLKSYTCGKTVLVFGNGASKIERYPSDEKFQFIDEVKPLAENMLQLAFSKFQSKEFENIDEFKPNYVKPYYTKQKSTS